jgi:hypothetical protein
MREEARVSEVWLPGNPNDRSIQGFCIRHGTSKGPMSKKAYYNLKRSGRGPRESYRGDVIFISPKAEADFDAACTDPKQIAKTKQRHMARAMRASAAAVASPKHVSKTRRRKKGPAGAGLRMPEHPKATQA